MTTNTIIGLVAMCVGIPVVFGALACLLKRVIGCDCHKCGHRMTAFKQLPQTDQQIILDHFKEIEKRTPDTTAIFACGHCGIVYDDFSGEKRSLDGDNISICKICGKPYVAYLGCFMSLPMYREAYRRMIETHKELIDKIECLRCERRPMRGVDCVTCDTPLKLTGCRYCSAIYLWGPPEGSKYRFLIPLTGHKILDGPIGLFFEER